MNSAEQSFDRLVAALDYPLFVVTAAGEEPSGCLVGFATQCSISPPRFLVCISDKNHTFPVATEVPALAVHVLPASAYGLAQLFGGETGDELDKFARCTWHPGPDGLPILDDCSRWFAGRVVDRCRLGDHVAFVLEPFAASDGDGSGEDALSFQQVKQLDPGHEP